MSYAINHRCAECGFPFGDHKSGDQFCPIGARHRVMGHINYSSEYFFRPVLPALPRPVTRALEGLLKNVVLDEEKRDAYTHMLALSMEFRSLLADNRQLTADLKEAKRWKA